MPPEDIDAALALQHFIGGVHRIAFPGAAVKIVLSPTESSYRAGYSRERDEYSIWVKNLAAAAKRDGRNKKACLIEYGESVRPLWARRFIRRTIGFWQKCMRKDRTRNEVLLLIAAHEVRHRMQAKLSGFRMFSADSKGGDPFLRRIIRLVEACFANTRQAMKRDGKTAAFIELRTNAEEFDSNVIEELLLHRMSDAMSRSEFAKILFLQPDEAR